MARYESVAIPFVKFGNRRGLTDLQLAQDPNLADFVQRFRGSFEPAIYAQAVLFIEPEMQKAEFLP